MTSINQKLFAIVTGLTLAILPGVMPSFASGTQSVSSAPTNLIAVPTSTTQIYITWNQPVNSTQYGVFGYQIQRNNTIIVNNTASSSTYFNDAGLLPNHQEQYSIAAWNPAGLSPFSNVSHATTLNQIYINPTPTNQTGHITNPGNNQTHPIFGKLGHKFSNWFNGHRGIGSHLNHTNSTNNIYNETNNYPLFPHGNQTTQVHKQNGFGKQGLRGHDGFSKLAFKSHDQNGFGKQGLRGHDGFSKLAFKSHDQNGFGKQGLRGHWNQTRSK